MLSMSIEEMQVFASNLEKAIEIAEELNAYVMVTNLRRTFDYEGMTVLYLPVDPTIKLLIHQDIISFSS